MINIGMFTPERLHKERSIAYKSLPFKEIFSSFYILGHSLLRINRRVIVSPFHDDTPCVSYAETTSTKTKPKAWSVRARRDVPNLLRGDR